MVACRIFGLDGLGEPVRLDIVKHDHNLLVGPSLVRFELRYLEKLDRRIFLSVGIVSSGYIYPVLPELFAFLGCVVELRDDHALPVVTNQNNTLAKVRVFVEQFILV